MTPWDTLSWLAVETTELDQLFERLQVSKTPEPDPVFEANLSGVPLHGGWFVLVAQGIERRLTDPAVLGELSRHGQCLTCMVEEHAMVSSATLWRSGRVVWSTGHDAQQGILHLHATGDLPTSFSELRERTMQEQARRGGLEAGVDLVFDLPLLLARELTGFKHDEEPTEPFQSEPRVFQQIGAPAPSRPWWRLW